MKYDLPTPKIYGIDPDSDHKVWTLSNSRIEQAMEIGYMRSKENESSADKAGYDKTDTTRRHSNADNDALGVAFEIACTEALGFDPDDASVITLFKTKPYGPDSPDIKGIYECRRLNDWENGITYFNKDVRSDAIIIAGLVQHQCDSVNKRILIEGPVTFIGWNYPAQDREYLKRGFRDGGTIKPWRMRPLSDLPLLGDAGWRQVVAA